MATSNMIRIGSRALFLFLSISSLSSAFLARNTFVSPTTTRAVSSGPHFLATVSSPTIEDLSSSQRKLYDFLEDIHKTAYKFRIVVVGSGAILESTHSLGPVMKLNKSPKTGEYLVTLASDDQSFELHVKIEQVAQIMFSEKVIDETNTLKIIRMVQSDSKSVCSLILDETSEDATKWFQSKGSSIDIA
mmetsp:Transcript_1166/g.1702  ORF Transcript_1166/g.1702 Transcript_1166/m.1702 type:complete len:189 (+) Transcript_1166:66-632(+)